MSVVQTRADRLAAIVRAVAPKAVAAMEAHAAAHAEPVDPADLEDGALATQVAVGLWPKRPLDDGREVHQAPYALYTLDDGRRQVKVFGDDGDVVAGVGTTVEEALAVLEAKLKIGEGAAQ